MKGTEDATYTSERATDRKYLFLGSKVLVLQQISFLKNHRIHIVGLDISVGRNAIVSAVQRACIQAEIVNLCKGLRQGCDQTGGTSFGRQARSG